MSAKNIVWVINGLGMGNATRCHSIMQYINESSDSEFNHTVFASGNGYQYFSKLDKKLGIVNVFEVNGFEYKTDETGNLSTFSTIVGIFSQIKSFLKSSRDISDFVKTISPVAIITDSTYFFIKKNGAKHIAINNADMVVSCFKDLLKADVASGANKINVEMKRQYRFVEFFDYLYHAYIPDAIVSPCFKDVIAKVKLSKNNRSNIFHVNPFKRMEVNCGKGLKGDGAVNILMMFTGSSCGSLTTRYINEVISEFVSSSNNHVRIDVIGNIQATKQFDSDNQVVFHGKLTDNISIINDADICVINAGFSAVGEMLIANKTFAVIPVVNHSEQYVNAVLAERYSNAIFADEISVELLNKLVKRHFADIAESSCRSVLENGSLQAANVIMEICKQ